MKEKLRILVVDDDRRMVRTICDILKVKGYEPIEAYSGEEAVVKAKEESPDCVLMDLKMPGIKSRETGHCQNRARLWIHYRCHSTCCSVLLNSIFKSVIKQELNCPVNVENKTSSICFSGVIV